MSQTVLMNFWFFHHWNKNMIYLDFFVLIRVKKKIQNFNILQQFMLRESSFFHTYVQKIGVDEMKGKTVNCHLIWQKCRAGKFIVRIWARDFLPLKRLLCNQTLCPSNPYLCYHTLAEIWSSVIDWREKLIDLSFWSHSQRNDCLGFLPLGNHCVNVDWCQAATTLPIS